MFRPLHLPDTSLDPRLEVSFLKERANPSKLDVTPVRVVAYPRGARDSLLGRRDGRQPL